jgi:hypothetical protein
MLKENNPLERIPSSRGGINERPYPEGGDYEDIVNAELEDGIDLKDPTKPIRVGLVGEKRPQVLNSEEDIPDQGLLPDQFEEMESDEDQEREAYIDKYNEEHKDQYKIVQKNKKGDFTEKFSVIYNNKRNAPRIVKNEMDSQHKTPKNDFYRKIA